MSETVVSSSKAANYRAPVSGDFVPPLKNGDRLTLREYMRRYEAMPEGTRAQLIQGIVYMAAAVRIRHHGRPSLWLANVVSTYGMRTHLDFGADSTVELDQENAPEPDLVMFLPAELGGRAKINEEGYLVGPPEFIAEVSASTLRIDLNDKLQAYEKSGVREYVVWRVLEQQVDWFVLEAGEFSRMPADEKGVFHSHVFPGLWLDVPALIEQDAERLWKTLDAGMATPEYREFATRVREITKLQANS